MTAGPRRCYAAGRVPRPNDDATEIEQRFEDELRRLEAERARIDDTIARVRRLLADARTLRAQHHSDTTEDMATAPAAGMPMAERVQHSRGMPGRDDALTVACHAIGTTQRALATRLRAEGYDITQSVLSRARRGIVSIRRSTAERIEQITGFRATPANWPGGWVGRDPGHPPRA